MIIVSQDKEEIVNFDLICNIFVFGSGIKCILADGCDTIIGEYKTQKRAKEVLEEIINMYKATESFIATANRISDNVGALAIQKGFVYYMPEE